MYYYPNAAGGYIPPQSNSILNQPGPVGLKGRPVSSIEEVRAAQIDFDGSLFVFPDLAHNRIYTKTINIDGTASLNMYELSQIPTQTPAIETSNFVTRDEFDKAVAELKTSLSQANMIQDQPKQDKPATPQLNF